MAEYPRWYDPLRLILVVVTLWASGVGSAYLGVYWAIQSRGVGGDCVRDSSGGVSLCEVSRNSNGAGSVEACEVGLSET